jgi:hypothetical protein
VRALVAAVALLAGGAVAHAGPWTRDAGHHYLNLSYQRIATSTLFSPDFSKVAIPPYEQHQLGFYGEVGVVSRWLTATIEGTLYRKNRLVGQGATDGVGDLRLGAWTGLVTQPVRLALGLTVGIPTGDPRPSAPPGADDEAQLIARSLPTGDGEVDVEGRLSLGYSFGRARRWPVEHYLVAEAGYWLRTAGFADAFVWRAELGTRLPWRFVERFWLIWRFTGVESFASSTEAARNATGLGNGVTFIAPGIEVFGRIWRGLGASFALDSALRARSVPAGLNLRFAVSWQW